MQNLLDKRSRFAPSTHSLLAICPVPRLLAPADPSDLRPRWIITGLLRLELRTPLSLPSARQIWPDQRGAPTSVGFSNMPIMLEFFAASASSCTLLSRLRKFLLQIATTAAFITAP
jgi:hypothetical protein